MASASIPIKNTNTTRYTLPVFNDRPFWQPGSWPLLNWRELADKNCVACDYVSDFGAHLLNLNRLDLYPRFSYYDIECNRGVAFSNIPSCLSTNAQRMTHFISKTSNSSWTLRGNFYFIRKTTRFLILLNFTYFILTSCSYWTFSNTKQLSYTKYAIVYKYAGYFFK